MIRSFIAFELKNQVALNEIGKLTARLKKNQPRMKAVESENIHLTMKFLGNIKESDAPKIYEILENRINNKILKNGPSIYKLKGLGNFRTYQIIWIALKGDIPLMQQIKDTIEDSLNQQLNIRKDKRRKFKPHITIARLKKKRIDYKTFDTFKNIAAEYKNYEFGEMEIDRIHLKKSELTPKGPIYTDLVY